MGFHVEAYHGSVRKQLRQASKFYLFDVGMAEFQARSSYEALPWEMGLTAL